MNCQDIIESMGFECAPRPNAGLRLFSPFTYQDGTGIGVYVQPLTSETVLVTDHGDTFMHLSTHGIDVTPRRVRWAQERCNDVQVSTAGALQMVVTPDRLGDAIASVLDAAMLIGHQQRDWAPEVDRDRFVKRVETELKRIAPKRLRRAPRITGFSGHQLEFPLGIDTPDGGVVYIQPIGTINSEMDWSAIYRATGKMLDIREAGVSPDRRVVVIDDSGSADEVPRAITMLNTSATVLPFSLRDNWLGRFAA